MPGINSATMFIKYSDFRKHLASFLHKVNNDKQIMIVSRSNGKRVVLLDLDEFNAIQETLHLTSNYANHLRLTQSLQEMDGMKFEPNRK